MSKELAEAKQNLPIEFNEDQLKLLKQTVAKDLNENEFMFFKEVCLARGLNPLLNQIHATIHRSNGQRRLTFITGIDGFRKTAHSTGKYAGRDKTQFYYREDKKPKNSMDISQGIIKCEVTIYKIVGGVRCPFTAEAYWEEYLPGDTKKRFMWKKMPHNMLEKCCEAKAIRSAFTNELSNFYEDAEWSQASDKEIDEQSDMNNIVNGKPETKKDVQHVEKEDGNEVDVTPPKKKKAEPVDVNPMDNLPSDNDFENEELPDWDAPPVEEKPPQRMNAAELLPVSKEQFQSFMGVAYQKGWKKKQIEVLMQRLCNAKTGSELKQYDIKTMEVIIKSATKENPPENIMKGL